MQLEKANKKNKGLKLLKRGRLASLRAIFSRCLIMLLLLAFQVFIIVAAQVWFEQLLPHYVWINTALTVVMVLYLINCNYDPSAKITWLVVIMVLPVFGTLFLIYTKSDIGHRDLKRSTDKMLLTTKDILEQDGEVFDDFQREDAGAAALARYLKRSGGFPVYRCNGVKHFPLGEDKFEELKKQLEQARRFIFLEYFIINEGAMWGEVLEILVRKVKEGVDVRVIYDGTCAFTYLTSDYPKRLEKLGIKCKMFLPIYPIISTRFNYRDHRKIVVIDGHTAFTGGVNLSDEYINETERFGHWKDTAVMFKGEAVRSFTLMFLQMWELYSRSPVFDEYVNVGIPEPTECRGFVIPYSDCPLDAYKTGEIVYIDILNRAKKSVHIMTPYLILDGELETAMKFAAERGVEVTVLLPGIPDKKVPYALAKTHYKSLLESGINIYEYTPGFVHAKQMVADGKEAVVGTINLDYRSLYHHFECAVYLYDVDCLDGMENDFKSCIENSRRVTFETIKKEKLSVKIMGFIMKTIAPLL